MVEYADRKRTQNEIRQMFLALIKRDNKAKADEFRRRILKDRIKSVLMK